MLSDAKFCLQFYIFVSVTSQLSQYCGHTITLRLMYLSVYVYSAACISCTCISALLADFVAIKMNLYGTICCWHAIRWLERDKTAKMLHKTGMHELATSIHELIITLHHICIAYTLWCLKKHLGHYSL